MERTRARHRSFIGNGTTPAPEPNPEPIRYRHPDTDRIDRGGSTRVRPGVSERPELAAPAVRHRALFMGTGAIVGTLLTLPVATAVIGGGLAVYSTGTAIATGAGALATTAVAAAAAGTSSGPLQAAAMTPEAAIAALRANELIGTGAEALKVSGRMALGSCFAGAAILTGGALTGALVGCWLAPSAERAVESFNKVVAGTTEVISHVLQTAQTLAKAASDAADQAREWTKNATSDQAVRVIVGAAAVYISVELGKAYINRNNAMMGLPGAGTYGQAPYGQAAYGQAPYGQAYAGHVPG